MANKATSTGNKKTAECSTLLVFTPEKKGINTFGRNHQKKFSGLLFKQLFVVLGLLLCTTVAFGQGNFSSNAATGNWNANTSWTLTSGSDADGVPDADDNVIVRTAHSITVTAAAACNSLEVNAHTSGSNNQTQLTIGAFTLTVTGNVTLRTTSSSATRRTLLLLNNASSVLDIGGNLQLGSNMSANLTATIDLSNAGANTATNLRIGGSMTKNSEGVFTSGTSSTVNFKGSTSAQTINVTNFIYANINVNNTNASGATLGAVVTAANITGNILIGNVSSGSLFSTGNFAMTLGNSKTLTVALGSTMVAGTSLITFGTSGTATINGTFKTAKTEGLSGAAATSISSNNNPTVTLGGSSTIEYNGSAQTITNTTYNNLTINQTSGSASLSGATTAVNGTLTLTNGTLNIGANNLTLGAAATISVTSPSATKMIIASGTGQVRKTFTANGSFTFPIGDNTGTVEYSPVTVDVTGTGFSSAYVGASVVDSKHPNNSSATNFLTRYWNINQSNITNCTATITGTYLSGGVDVSGTEGSINSAQLNGTFMQSINPWVKFIAIGSNTLFAAGATITAGETSAFTGINGANPTVSISGGGGTICNGASVGLTATGSGLSPFVYSWSPTTGLSSFIIANPIAAPTTTTTYTVTVRDANGIPATNTTTITVNPRPTSVISGSFDACGSTVSIALTGTPPWSLTYFDGTTSTPVVGIVSSPHTFSAPPSGSSLTYTVTALSDANCTSQASDRTGSAIIGANNPPTITVQPSTGIITGCPGEVLTPLSITANPGGGTITTYQWYSNVTNTTSGGTLVQTTSTSATTDSHTPSTAVAGTLFYYCVVTTTGPSCSVTSDISGSITVDAPPSISVQPSTAVQNVCQNDAATALFVTATGSNLVYEWFSSNDAANNTAGDDISVFGPTAASSFTPSTAVLGTKYYYCIISGSCLPEATSNVSGATTINALPAITVQPSTSSSIVCLGVTAPTLSVTATGTGLTYQWYTNTSASNSGGSPVGGATASTFVPSTSNQGTSYYYCEVKSSANCLVNSDVSGAITVPLVITTQPAASQALVVGGSLSFTVAASPGSTFQWRKGGVDLSNGGNISGATTATLTLNPAAASDAGTYSVVVSNSACGVSITSNDSYLVSAMPGTQANNIVFGTITSTSIALSWANGSGSNRIVVAHAGSAVNQSPVNTSTYFASSAMGTGDEITTGSGNYVVFNGTGTAVTVTGLSPSVNYYFQVFEYNGTGTATSYLTSTATNNPNNQSTTPSIQSTGFSFTNISPTGMTLNWTTNGDGANRIVVARAGSAPISNGGNPSDGGIYTANGSFGSGTQIGTGNYVVFNGTGSSISVTGLTQNTTYFFNVYEYNGTSSTSTDKTVYLTSPAPATNSQLTPTATGPLTQASNIVFSTITSTSLTLTWTNGSGQNRMVVGQAGSAISSDPVDGDTYLANTVFGSGTQLGSGNYTVFNGSGNTVTVTGLVASTTYYFKVYEYNNAGAASKYSTFSATNNPNNQSTRPDIQATAIVFTTDENLSDQVTLNWTNGNGTSRIVFVHENAAVNATPVDGIIYTANATYGSGSQVGTGNYVVFNGTGNSVTVTGLDDGSDYFFRVFEYSGTNASASSTTNLTEYLTSTATGNPALVLMPGRFAYRSKASGDWSNSAIWETFDVKTGLWVDTNKTPKKNNNITISDGDLVTIIGSETSDQIVVNGTLQINNGGTLTVDFNTKQPYNLSMGSSGKLDVHGTYAIADKSVTLGHTAGNTHVFSTGTYNHLSRTEGIVPLATWDAGSTLNISGYNNSISATINGNWSQSFSNVIFACALGANTVDMKGLLTSIGGNLTVNNTGTTGRLLLNGGTSSPAITIDGNVNVTPIGGVPQLVLNSSTGSPTVTVNGSINVVSGGTFSFGAAGALGTATVNLKNNLTNAGTLTNSSAGAIGQLNFTNGTTAHTFSNTGTMSGRIHVTVVSSNILDVGASAIVGTGNFTLSSTATLRLGSTDPTGTLQTGTAGGNLRNSGTRTFGSPSTIEFISTTTAQVMGNGFPSTGTVHLINNNTSGDGLTAPVALTLGGDFTNNGPFVPGSGTVTFATSTNTKDIKGSFKVTFNNLTINGGAAAAPDVRLENTAGADLAGVLDVTTNPLSTFDADGAVDNRVFTLLSSGDNPTVDASIAQMSLTVAQVQGKVTVQRFMSKEPLPNSSIYRYISSPVQNGSVADIQQEIPVSGSFAGSNGGGQTMFRYVESVAGNRNNGYRDFPANSNTETLEPGVGYVFLARGSIIGGTNALWDIRGDVNSGTIPLTVSKSGTTDEDGWNLVGNPFPSTIDWDAASGWQKSSLNDAIYTTDNGTGNATIKYASYIDNVSTNDGSRYVASGQAFWVFANTSGTPGLVIDEQAKVAGTQTIFFREAGPTDVLRITLVKDQSRDETVIRFKEGSTPKFDGQSDAYKMSNGGLNLCSITEANEFLAINSMPSFDCNHTIRLSIWNVPAGTYKLDFSQYESFPEALSIIVKDNFTKTEVDVRNAPSYEFVVTSDVNSYGNNRFSVDFSAASINTQFEASATDICMGNEAQLTILGTSAYVQYSVMLQDGTEATSAMGNDAALTLTIPKEKLIAGQNIFTIKSLSSYCSTSTYEQTVEFLVDEIPSAPIVENTKRCLDGIVTLVAKGSPSENYNWYENETDLNPIDGNHSSTFSTPFLSKTKNYYVSSVNLLGCEGPRAQVMAEVIQYDDVIITRQPPDLISSYAEGNQWYLNGVLIPGAVDQTYKPKGPGTYGVEVLIDGCSTFDEIDLSSGQSAKHDKDVEFSAYPNPVESSLNIVLANPNNLDVTITMTDMKGMEALAQSFEASDDGLYAVSTEQLPTGMYTLYVRFGSSVRIAKIMKE